MNLGQIFSRQNIFKHVFFESLWKYHLPRKGLFHRTFFSPEILFYWTVQGGPEGVDGGPKGLKRDLRGSKESVCTLDCILEGYFHY